jgi:hypothetical protein
MAVDAGRQARRGRVHDARLAKERRQKIFLATAGGLLLVILAVQLPGLLHRLHGSSASPPTTSATGTTAANGSAGGTAAKQSAFLRRLAALASFRPTDPFVQQIATGGATKSRPQGGITPRVRTIQLVVKDPFVPQIATGGATKSVLQGGATPRVRANQFVIKDPFQDQLSSQSTSGPVSASKPSSSPTASGHGAYIVILASVPVPQGLAAARRIAKTARARGIDGAGVLTSAGFHSLRPGFYVVFGGMYKSARAAAGGLDAARAHGFLTAYPRFLGG